MKVRRPIPTSGKDKVDLSNQLDSLSLELNGNQIDDVEEESAYEEEDEYVKNLLNTGLELRKELRAAGELD